MSSLGQKAAQRKGKAKATKPPAAAQPQGETFTKSEAAATLSSAVNLYRYQDVHFIRMFHLIARDLCPIADEVPLVTSSLLKDVNTGSVAYRENAIRLLRHITNDTSLNKAVKFLDEALCDYNPMLQIASLVCAISLIRRTSKVGLHTLGQVYPESTVSDKGKHIQFHAILYIMHHYWGGSVGFTDGVVGICSTDLKDAMDVMRRILRVSHKPGLRFSSFRALQKVGMVHNVVWTTPEDRIAIGLDVNVYKLYNHRDNEPEAEQVSQLMEVDFNIDFCNEKPPVDEMLAVLGSIFHKIAVQDIGKM
ncbi:hypothetical protein SASPL_151822 [Salvia splendens]|uniref:Uncharacterized protein n=1 Tax=Salvia splendens TaxID=180675 RepID=A0A8X8Z0B0_SALSN|nr:hypothetical protein SASPL_151822 [Salvia splendens]